jgi:hypothetical protein
MERKLLERAKDLVRVAVSATEAKAALRRELKHNRKLSGAVLEVGICYLVRSIYQHDRDRNGVSRQPGEFKPGEDHGLTAMMTELTVLETWRLASCDGLALGRATRPQLLTEAAWYDEQAAGNARRARQVRAIAAELTDDLTQVGVALTADQVSAILAGV